MSYVAYKVIHYLGIFVLVVALGAALGRRMTSEGPDPLRKRFVGIHGLGLFLVLLGGFGLLARIGVSHGALFPGWVWGKLAIWTVLGGVLMLARRKAAWSMPLILVVPALATLAGVLAFLKPF